MSVASGSTLQVTPGNLPNGQVQVAYSATVSASGGTTPYSWSVSAGSLPSGLTLSAGGGIAGTPTGAGTFDFTVKVTDSSSPAQTATLATSITVNPASGAPLSISTTSLPAGTAGSAYSSSLAATGGATPYSWSVSAGSLPTGLALSAAGAITGTPSATGTFNFTAKVTDSSSPAQTSTKALSIVVNATPQPLSISTTSLPAGTSGTAYSTTLSATGGTTPYSWSISAGSLPTGLALNANSGAIAGSPTQTGTFNFTAKVKDSEATPQTATQALSLTVNAAALQITTTTLPAGTVGTSYSASFAASGGVSPYSWSVISGSLPAGLSLSSAGSISGTPSTAGTSSFEVQAKDSTAATASANFSININNVGQNASYNCNQNTNTCSTAVVQKATTPFSGLTGANKAVTPSDFGNLITRITDTNTLPAGGQLASGSGSYASDFTGNGNANLFNTNSTMVLVGEVRSETMIPLVLNTSGANPSVSRLCPSTSAYAANGGFVFPGGAEAEFSRVNPNLVYVEESGSRGVTRLVSYDLSTCPVTGPTLVHDFSQDANCLGSVAGSPTFGWTSPLDIADNDSAFGFAFSTNGQDSTGAIYIVAWTPGKGCRMLNTSNNAVTGDYGTTGTLTYNTGNNNFEYLHGARLSRDGNWFHYEANNCTGTCDTLSKSSWWNINTLNGEIMYGCQSGSGGPCPAHVVMNESSFMSNVDRGLIYQQDFTDVTSNPVVYTTLQTFNDPSNVPFDSHDNWSNSNPSQQCNPIMSSTYNQNGEETTFSMAFEAEEILWTACTANGSAYRVAHHFGTSNNARFSISIEPGAISQDGKWLIFTSDMQGGLGSESGASTCSVTGSFGGTVCRGDVFLVTLPVLP